MATKDQNEVAQEKFLDETPAPAPEQPKKRTDNKIEFPTVENTDPRHAKIGWYGIARNELPYEGRLYPKNWEFEIRAITGNELAYYSTIDSNDPISVLDGMNMVIKNCLRIKGPEGLVDPMNVYEIDRMFFLLKIRDLSLPERENALVIREKCPFKCSDSENQVEITANSLVYEPLSEFAEKYVDTERGGFTVKTKSLGDIHFTPSTLEQAEAFKTWFMNQNPESRDNRFATRYNLYLNRDKVYRKPEQMIVEAFNNFYAISVERNKISVYMKIEREIQPKLSQEMKYICPNCGREVHTAFRFPGELSDIFLTNNIDSEFL